MLRAVGEAVRRMCRWCFRCIRAPPRRWRRCPTSRRCLRLVDPQPYLEFNYLVQHARGVITDSGGVTEETTVMGVPCLTLRDTTERPETVTVGTNELIGTDPAALKPALDRLFAGQWKKGSIPEKWDGRTGERIAEVLGSPALSLATPWSCSGRFRGHSRPHRADNPCSSRWFAGRQHVSVDLDLGAAASVPLEW